MWYDAVILIREWKQIDRGDDGMDEKIIKLLKEQPELIPLVYEWIGRHREKPSQHQKEKE